jgi:antitoxin VapB
MSLTKVFKSGNSQAVRLPKEFQFDVGEVEIFRRGDEVVLRKPRPDAGLVFDLLTALPQDFMAEGREQPPLEQREEL